VPTEHPIGQHARVVAALKSLPQGHAVAGHDVSVVDRFSRVPNTRN
jgi:hypothetical protein